jgi:hypothetical protein
MMAWIRLLLGAALLALASWWATEAILDWYLERRIRRVAARWPVDVDTGEELVGIRIDPLDERETAAAADRERELLLAQTL